MINIPYLLALHSINGLGPLRLKTLIGYFKDPKLAWEADTKEIKSLGIPQKVVEIISETRKILDPQKYTEGIKNSGISWISIFDDNYPTSLSQIYDPPIILYYKGEILPEDERSIGVVGTRKMSGYGELVTEKFCKYLSDSGLTIVSGLARGVDSKAHWIAVKNNGRTIAVLGGGLNNIYPPENKILTEEIINGFGAIISEYPPDYPSLPGNFPSRNRIISGLSKAILVTEAAQDSGSLITARLAAEQGRDVFVIPGPITSDLSKGPISLIKEGATVVIEPSEILEAMGINNLKSQKEKVKIVTGLSNEEKQILACLDNENMHIDEICRKLNYSSSNISAFLIKMEIIGLVQNLGGGHYCKI